MPISNKDKAFRRLPAGELLFLPPSLLKRSLLYLIDVEALTLEDMHHEEGGLEIDDALDL